MFENAGTLNGCPYTPYVLTKRGRNTNAADFTINTHFTPVSHPAGNACAVVLVVGCPEIEECLPPTLLF